MSGTISAENYERIVRGYDSRGQITDQGRARAEAWARQNNITVNVNGQVMAPPPAPPRGDQPAAERTTPTAAADGPDGNDLTAATEYVPAADKNILNNYKSYTYNFALGAVPVDIINNRGDITQLDNAINDYHVLDSAGKGRYNGGGITEEISSTAANASEIVGLVSAFNDAKDSPGVFDMYLESLEIDSLISTGSQQTGNANTTGIEFTVIEPYSINGFFEALTVAALAAGYPQYIGANFCLRIQFQGYRDDASLSEPPEIIPRATRYLMLTLTSVEFSVNDAGAKYKCVAMPQPQLSFGRPNIQLGDIKANGLTAFDVLRSYFRQINESSKTNAIRAAGGDANALYDRYEISAPTAPPQSVLDAMIYSETKPFSEVATSSHNDIVKARMINGLQDRMTPNTDNSVAASGYNAIPTSPATDGGTTANDRAVPNLPEFSFAAGQQIHESIAAIVRDSEYVRDNVLRVQLPRARETNGLIDYFKIRMEVENGDFNPRTNSYVKIHRYVLEPFKILYTRLPTQALARENFSALRKQIRREYQYMYTGKNTDVLKFDLKFDLAFYQDIPKAFGNREEIPATPDSAGPPNGNRAALPQLETQPSATTTVNSVPTPVIATNPNSVNNTMVTAGPDQYDPYHILAREFHAHLMNTVHTAQAEMEILGDPYFLVTGNTRNQDIELARALETTNGEAPANNTEIFIYIQFRNPVDISKDKNPSLAVFRKGIIPWSGIFVPTLIKNRFKDGVFTQLLQMYRQPGQVITDEDNEPAGEITSTRSPEPGVNVTEDSAPPTVNRVGITKDRIDITGLFNRGLPSVGLPGVPTDFTSAVAQTRATFLTRVSGLSREVDSQLGITPVSDLQQTVASVNISPEQLNAAMPDPLAASVGAAGALVQQVGNIENAATNLAQEMLNSVPTLERNLTQEVNNLAGEATRVVGDVENAVSRLINPITTDPSGVVARLGIDPTRVSGLGRELSTKLTEQLNAVADLVPPNANLAGLSASGVVFRNMTGANLANLPPLQPNSAAPDALFDPARVAIVDSLGSVVPLLQGQANLAALTQNNRVTNSIGSAAAAFERNARESAQTMLDKLGTVQLSVNDISSLSLGVRNPVGSLNQNALSSPSPASVGLGSVESNAKSVDALVQSVAILRQQQMGMTLNDQFGSNQTVSPLTTLVQNSNIRGTIA